MKIRKNGLAALCALLMVFTMLMITACPPEAGESVYLDHLQTTHFPHKTTYVIGEELDIDGLEITAFYSNGSSHVVTDYTIDREADSQGRIFLEQEGNITIFVSWGGKSSAFTVFVIPEVEPDQIVLAGYFDLKVDGEFPAWENFPPELILCPEDTDIWDSNAFIPFLQFTLSNQWMMKLDDLNETYFGKYYFWVGMDGYGAYKTSYHVTLSELGVIIDGIDIHVELFTEVTIQGTVNINNPNIKNIQLRAYNEYNQIDSCSVNLNESNSFTFGIYNILKGTELTIKINGIDDQEETLTVDSNNIQNVTLNFDLSSVTEGHAWLYFNDAFEANNNLYLSSWLNDHENRLRVDIYDQLYYDPQPVREYSLFVNGIERDIVIIEHLGNDIQFYISTTTLSAGWNYATVIVAIDGTPFAKDFAFWVNQK
ncbi:MAG: bacterial Ig-like domain-containing protein [Treponema sp.]|nr:bacterial Ig-like domain-containing protein [Treponema sp.]MCL2237309.1 bacterial Ig-like domain-containing protein [Treponema sp.]